MIRIVLDTNVVASGLLWGGSPWKLMQVVRETGIPIYTSLPLVAELMAILSRSKFTSKLHSSGDSVEGIVNSYLMVVELVNPVDAAGQAPDPDDDVVIGTALAAKADLLVTGDKALLGVRAFKGGRIVSVAEALRSIETPESLG
jgi:putative PIN family toxin of toxin-antitoxin system